MGVWKALTGGNSRWDADLPTKDRRGHAADLITGRGSKHNGDKRQANVERRRDDRKDKRAQKQAEKKGWWS
jgi:hypothetical protein